MLLRLRRQRQVDGRTHGQTSWLLTLKEQLNEQADRSGADRQTDRQTAWLLTLKEQLNEQADRSTALK